MENSSITKQHQQQSGEKKKYMVQQVSLNIVLKKRSQICPRDQG